MKFIGLQLGRRNLGSVAQVRQTLPIRFPLLDKGDLVHRSVLIVLLLVLTAHALAAGSKGIIEAKIAAVTSRGFVLQVGTDSIEVEQTSKTKFWKNRSPADQTAFKDGDLVTARIGGTAAPPQLREMADRRTWDWLENVRQHPQVATVSDIYPKTLDVRFPDGTEFSYRTTKKSKVTLRGQPDANLSDLHIGQRVYVKGKTTSTYDTSLVEVSDTPIQDPRPPTTSPGKSKPGSRGASPAKGTLDGNIKACWPQYRMFDMLQGNKVVHVSFNVQTKFTLDSKPTAASSLRSGLRAVISYRRDKFGRIVAIGVELSTQLQRNVRTGVGKSASASSEEHFP